MQKKKIMVIYETAGGGHYAAAKAIESALGSMYPGSFEVVLMPVRAATGSQRVSHMMDMYNHLLKIKPSYSNMGMRVLNRLNVEKVVMPLMPKAARNLAKTMDAVRPDMIISVFAVVNHAAIETLKQKEREWGKKVPYVIWCTDLTKGFLRNWANRDADLTIALHPQAKEQLVEYGVPEAKIRVLSGLPVNQKFLAKVPKFEARQAFGLDPTRFTVLISMGGVAVSATHDFARELATSGLPVQVIAVCGRNESLRVRCEALAAKADIPIKVLGFTDQMHMLMDAADIMVGKPGPGTIAEAIAKELPMLIDATSVPMLQEAGNLELVVRQNLGQAISKDQTLTALVSRYMDNAELYAQTQRNLRRAKNDRAIEELIDIALSQLPGGPPARLQAEPGPVEGADSGVAAGNASEAPEPAEQAEDLA
ncbi:MAG: glycosyltransferase [Candidatus Sericytochromatia bacterium]|nr:glycosyltransferase [Candidatus Sericytochromatia bacterium]